MAIYIKGMEMPKNCGECWEKCLHVVIDCEAKGDPDDGKIRCNDCPLTEVPEPHGRLVDMDKALEVIALEYGYDGIEDDMEYKVPTVIESEGKE